MEHDSPFGNSNRENFPLFLGIFQWDEPEKRVPFAAEPEIPEILTKWKATSGYTIKPKKNSKTTNRHQNAVDYIAGKSFLFFSFKKK